MPWQTKNLPFKMRRKKSDECLPTKAASKILREQRPTNSPMQQKLAFKNVEKQKDTNGPCNRRLLSKIARNKKGKIPSQRTNIKT